jgi:hypothetical protein
MMLLTKEIRAKLPPLYATEDTPMDKKVAVVKFFTPFSNWTWFACEFDGEDTFFGYVMGLDNEWGYFTLSELASVKGPLGCPGVERDKFFKPQPIPAAALA